MVEQCRSPAGDREGLCRRHSGADFNSEGGSGLEPGPVALGDIIADVTRYMTVDERTEQLAGLAHWSRRSRLRH